MGTYYDRPADDCLLCPEGSYSPKEGALVCERCPEGTWTLGTRKENFTACTGNCFGFNFWCLSEKSLHMGLEVLIIALFEPFY